MTPVLRCLLPAALVAVLTGVPLAVSPASAGSTSVATTPSRPAEPCTDLDLNDEAAVVERADAVDDVFVGRVNDVVRRRGAGGEAPTSGPTALQRNIAHRVTVTTVLAGDLRLGQKVTIYFERASDGSNRVLRPRQTHLFFTNEVNEELRADYCDGSQQLQGGLSAPLQRRLEDFLSGAPAPPTRVALQRPSGGADEPPRLSRVVAPGAALSLVGVLGLFLVVRLGRRG